MITASRGFRAFTLVALLIGVASVWAQPGSDSQDGGRRGFGGPGGGRGGPGGGFGGPGRGFSDPSSLTSNLGFRRDLADELGLSDSQQEQLNAIRDEQRNAMREMFTNGGGFTPGQPPSDEQRKEFEKKMADMRSASDQKALRILTDDQKAKWEVKKAEFVKEAADREAARAAAPAAVPHPLRFAPAPQSLRKRFPRGPKSKPRSPH
jgi:hypothetical protein